MSNTAETLSSSPTPKIDPKAIWTRIVALLGTPAATWATIRGEAVTVKQLYLSYIAVIAAIPPVAIFLALISYSFFNNLIRSILMYAGLLATIYLTALIISKIAAQFKTTIDLTTAVKLVGYSATPACLAGILFLFGSSTLLGVAGLISLYGVYLFVVGVPILVTVAEDQKMPLIGACVIIALIVGFVVNFLVEGLSPSLFSISDPHSAARELQRSIETLQKMHPLQNN